MDETIGPSAPKAAGFHNGLTVFDLCLALS
jgi:hypothetical protein